MKRIVALIVAAAAAVVMTASSADAHWRRGDKRIKQVEIGAAIVEGAAFWAIIGNRWTDRSVNYRWGAYGAVAAGCVALSPMVATAVVQRPLSNREAHILMASCIVPFVGGWLVDQAYAANPGWEQPAPRAMKMRKKKKM